MNKYGICEWSLPVSGPAAIRLAGEMGYDGMQLGEAGGRANAYPLNNPWVQEIYMKAARLYNVEFQGLNLGALLGSGDMNFPAGTPRGDNARLSLLKGFEACRAMNIPLVVITFDSDDEESFVNNISHVKYAEELSLETGVKISIESAMTLPRIQRMLDEVSPEDKICMDLLNPLRFCTGDPQEQIRVFGCDRIDHFHMKDSISSLFVKGQRGCVPLGTGDADLPGSCRIIRELGFEGWFITENYYMFPPMNDGEQDFIELARNDLQAMKDLI